MSFYAVLSRHYDALFPANEQQIGFLAERLKGVSTILDLGAGTGTTALGLIKKGFAVTGLEFDRSMADRMREKAALAGAQLPVIEADMRRLPDLPLPQFEGIYCIGNTLVHLADELEIAGLLQAAYQQLASGGRLVIQIVNYDAVLGHSQYELPQINRPEAGVSFRRIYGVGPDRVQFHGLLTEGDETWENTVPLVPLTRAKLEATLTATGFQKLAWYGSFKGEPCGPTSPALIVSAEK